MDALQTELLAILKEHAKAKDEISQTVAANFTEERFDQLTADLIEVLKQHSTLQAEQNQEV